MVFNGACALHGAGMGQSNDKVIRSWPKFILSWLKLVQSWCKFVLRWLKLQTLGSQTDTGRLKLRTWTSKMDPGTKSIGARRHRGGTGEAPRRHRGGTKEAPSSQLHIEMGPRAAFKSYKILEHISVDRSGLI